MSDYDRDRRAEDPAFFFDAVQPALFCPTGEICDGTCPPCVAMLRQSYPDLAIVPWCGDKVG